MEITKQKITDIKCIAGRCILINNKECFRIEKLNDFTPCETDAMAHFIKTILLKNPIKWQKFYKKYMSI